MYPIQMMDIQDPPFDKIATHLIMDLNISASGNQHIPTIINHLTGWPETSPILNKKADTIICIFITIFYLIMEQNSKIRLWMI